MSITDGSIEYEVRTMPSTKNLQAFVDNNINAINSSIRLTNNTENLSLLGGINGDSSPALVLIGKDANTNGGTFSLRASDGTNIVYLIGKKDGTLTWDNNKVMVENKPTSAAQIIRNVDNSSFYIAGGYGGTTKGAVMQVFGKDHSDCPGYFKIFASNGTNNSQLIGIPDGTLTWAGNDLAGAAIVAKSLNFQGYIKYASGLKIQWGYVEKNNSTSTNTNIIPANSTSGRYDGHITYPISFESTIYKVIVIPNSAAPCYATVLNHTQNSTGVYTFLQETTAVGIDVRFIAIGY